jgi:hypothetical protein
VVLQLLMEGGMSIARCAEPPGCHSFLTYEVWPH